MLQARCARAGLGLPMVLVVLTFWAVPGFARSQGPTGAANSALVGEIRTLVDIIGQAMQQDAANPMMNHLNQALHQFLLALEGKGGHGHLGKKGHRHGQGNGLGTVAAIQGNPSNFSADMIVLTVRLVFQGNNTKQNTAVKQASKTSVSAPAKQAAVENVVIVSISGNSSGRNAKVQSKTNLAAANCRGMKCKSGSVQVTTNGGKTQTGLATGMNRASANKTGNKSSSARNQRGAGNSRSSSSSGSSVVVGQRGKKR